MEVDFRSLTLGRTDDSMSDSEYDWSFVKENTGITLLFSRHPAGGTCYKIMEGFATASQKQIFPTTSLKSKDGNSSVERDAKSAYHQFQVMVSTGVGTSSKTGLLPSLATSFEDLDDKLVSLAYFDKKLIRELQRTGINDFGSKKSTLDLRYPENSFTWDDTAHLQEAAIRYDSYTKDLRINALKDIRESILIQYMEDTIMSQIIQANRLLRQQYAQSEYEGSLNDFSSNESSPILPDSTYSSISVKFIDQKGNEVVELPYIVSVRGGINFRDSWLKTNGGKDPAAFASGSTLFESVNDSENGRHYLYRYKINDEVPHRGSFKVQVIVPEYARTSPWANNRLKIYGGVPETENDREGSIISTKSGVVLTSQAFTFRGAGSHHEVRVPVYREPLPTHIVETSDGQLVSKWSTLTDINKLPRHQKVRIKIKLSRLRHSELWESADLNSDGVIDQSEYQSPQGENARNDIDFESKIPVRGVKVELRPSKENTWLTSRNAISSTSDLSGSVSLTVPVGEYTAFIVSQNDTGEVTENQIGVLEVPAGVFYRNTTVNDTTPIGVIGASMTESNLTLVDFNLKKSVPRLPKGKKAEYGTIYAISSLTGIENGWPNSAGSSTDETIFDEFEVILSALPREIILSQNLEDISNEEEDIPTIQFGETIEMTQASQGSVVTGIDPTPSGTKWKITRLAIGTGSPTVTFSDQYNPDNTSNQFGENNYSTANITFPRATTMGEGTDMLVFYPDIAGSIVAYPTESVTIGTPGDGKNYTFSIEADEIENQVLNQPSVNIPLENNVINVVNNILNNAGGDGLPTPVVSEPILQNNISDGLPTNIINQQIPNTIAQNSQSIINSYGSANLTYWEAANRLQNEHGWSNSNAQEALDPLSNQHQAALNSAAQMQNNANFFEHVAQQQPSNSSSLPAAVQNALNRLAQENAQAQANAAAAQAQANAESVQRAAQAQANAQENAQAQANALEAVSAMNTNGDGFITWKNGLSNNEIATRLAESQAAANALAAEAATNQYQAAQAAEYERIQREIAAGGRPRL